MMIIPVYIQWEIDPARLPYQQWFSTTGLREQLIEGKNAIHAASTSLIENEYSEHNEPSANRQHNSFQSFAGIDEHDVRLYIASLSAEHWDTVGSMWLPDDDAMEAMEQGSRFWLWEEEVLAVVTVMERTMDHVHHPFSMRSAGYWNYEAAPVADVAADCMKQYSF